MRDNSYDRTIERNYLQKWRFLIREYEAVKAGRSSEFRRVGEFYRFHGTCSQTFRKYYNRFLQGGSDDDLLPRRRGPKWRSRRTPDAMEALVTAQRRLGLNRYEIHAVLREHKEKVPCISTIHRILVRHGLNRKTPAMTLAKRRIIKDRLGELGHIDLHQLPQDMFLKAPQSPAYVISLIDSCSRLAWAEVVASKKALPVMFKTLKIINTLNVTFGLQFEAIMTDNGAEFAARTNPQNHPFEALLLELGVKHRYTRPYRPQTNGKIERFWRTLGDDLIEGTTFDDIAHFENELFQYMVYYNKLRPHQAINGLTPNDFAETKKQSTNE